ncbi:MAG: site-2 protease family protein [Ruminiclostridium sp.]|nr:site-2 protease family protein [Ruminiclostridium sp.]
MDILSNILNVLITILVFFGIILIHEMGHFLTARAFGMKIYEFSIGMGPRLFSKRTKTTTWSFKLLPIGGAVQLGEDFESDDPDDFRNKPVWQRMIVIVAGAVMNLILGFAVCIVSICTDDAIATTRLSEFYDTAVSTEVLMPDDEITEINGMPIWTTMDISYCLQNKAAKFDEEQGVAYFDMKVKRGGETVALTVPFKAVASDGRTGYSVVIDFKVWAEHKDPLTVTAAAARMFMTESRLIWISFADLITGTYGLNDLSGPVGVVTTMASALEQSRLNIMSLSSFLTLVALITINLGIFNLLPIPALDGARFLFLVIEAIRRKPIAAEKEGWVHFIGFAALMLLMLIVTFNDIVKLIAPPQ